MGALSNTCCMKEVGSCFRISVEAFFNASGFLWMHSNTCGLKYAHASELNFHFCFCTRNERNFVLVELSVTGKSPGRSPTSEYFPFFNVPATIFVPEYPQFIESML